MGERSDVTPGETPDATTRADLTALLTSEIERLGEDQSRGGMTTWVLAASAGALMVYCADLWTAELDFRVFCTTMTVVSFSLYTAISWFWEQPWAQFNRDPSRARIASKAFATQRTPLIVLTALGLILSWVVWNGRQNVQPLIGGLGVAAMVLGVLGGLIAIVTSFSSLEIEGTEPAPRNLTTVIVMAVIVVWVAVVIGGFAAALPKPFLPTHLRELKMSVGVFSLGLTIYLLAGQSHRDPTYWALLEIRRSLLLSRLTVEEARRQAELALLGLDTAARVDLRVRQAVVADQTAEQAIAAFELALVRLDGVLVGEQGPLHKLNRLVRREEQKAGKSQRAARKALVRSAKAYRKLRGLDEKTVGPSAYSQVIDLRSRRSGTYPRYARARRILAEWMASERRAGFIPL